MKSSADRAGGFTLVELLVAITIIGILIALLMPAVQGARESGRRTTCANNLKQLGLAAQQHVEKIGYFPSSGWGYRWVGDPDMGFGAKQPGGWMYDILPFMGLSNVHDLGKGMTNAADKKAAIAEQQAAVIPLFHCPSRRRAKGYPVTQVAPFNGNNPAAYAMTDYAANGGSYRYLGQGPLDASCPGKYPNCSWRVILPSSNVNMSYQQLIDHLGTNFDGLSGIISEIRPAHITDGLSRTIFAGEKYLNPEYFVTGSSCVDNNAAYQGNDWDTNRWFVGIKPDGEIDTQRLHSRTFLQDTPGYQNCTERFGSSHTVGVQFVFCDGSVHSLSYDTDPMLQSRLGNRKDGVKFDVDF